MDVKSVLTCCLNAPAKIINHEFCYLVVKTKADAKEEVGPAPENWSMSYERFPEDIVVVLPI